jgi:hypothetical protein
MVGAWFLMSSNKLPQRLAIIFFTAFHLYSGILVEYRYPATVLPTLLILFGPWYQHTKVPLDRKSLIGWSFIGLLVFLQFTPRMIEGDEKLTLEGNKYGLYMFESNHQCISKATIFNTDGSSSTKRMVSVSARSRCNTYNFWFSFKQMCEKDDRIEKISWTLDHSINGDAFLRIVDEENVCNLEYKPFSHNAWIKSSEDNPKVIGWPVKNYFD